MPIRMVPLVNGEVYHICNKSIAGFKIFNNNKDCDRIVGLMSFYIAVEVPCKFSIYKRIKSPEFNFSKRLVDIVAYCIMPTHIHLILKQNQDNGIEKFMRLISNAYSKYFNIRYLRKGPLWEGRFKNVLIKDDEQLLHLTRYVHLNPVTASLVNDPGAWKYSSYNEYLAPDIGGKTLCTFSDLLKIDPVSYKKFVLDQIDHQKQLAIIKKASLAY